eukprot:TRINITY_DN90395_c0_g1_i1.p1 TRINITY_DN90395_c0_g1~~TRINITY_DN90395_c0_g1_i1.p1  ORF type:complete len:680 (+),score=205.42 TRINITY_DN90395_c0_g1_i1:85-2124(+)
MTWSSHGYRSSGSITTAATAAVPVAAAGVAGAAQPGVPRHSSKPLMATTSVGASGSPAGLTSGVASGYHRPNAAAAGAAGYAAPGRQAGGSSLSQVVAATSAAAPAGGGGPRQQPQLVARGQPQQAAPAAGNAHQLPQQQTVLLPPPVPQASQGLGYKASSQGSAAVPVAAPKTPIGEAAAQEKQRPLQRPASVASVNVPMRAGDPASLEFYSKTHGTWIPAQVIARDPGGAVQIDKKPGQWLSLGDARLRAVAADGNETPPVPSNGPSVGVASSTMAAAASGGPAHVGKSASASMSAAATAAAPSPVRITGSGLRSGLRGEVDRNNLGEVSETVRYRCPMCNSEQLFCSMDEALAHCLGDSAAGVAHGVQAGGSSGSRAAVATAAASEAIARQQGQAADDPDALPDGEVIAYDARGRACIVRQVYDDSGIDGKTLIRNEDGSRTVFDLEAVRRLFDKETKDMRLAELRAQELRGLVHEVGQRLVHTSKRYHDKLAELKSIDVQLAYTFFGLQASSSDRDLENAYKKMARQMHPDKNGGTEEAKKKFQHMKERYEKLKKTRESDSNAGAEPSASGNGSETGAGPEERQQRREVGEAEALAAQPKGARREPAAAQEPPADTGPPPAEAEQDQKPRSMQAYDVNDKSSLQRTAGKMLEQLADMEASMDILLRELQRAASLI